MPAKTLIVMAGVNASRSSRMSGCCPPRYCRPPYALEALPFKVLPPALEALPLAVLPVEFKILPLAVLPLALEVLPVEALPPKCKVRQLKFHHPSSRYCRSSLRH